MKPYRVILSPRAFRQLGDIERWIAEKAGVNVARRYRQAVVEHCHQLEHFPDRGRSRDDLRNGLQTIVYRRKVTIAYRMEGDAVVIVAVVGKGRSMESALVD